MTNNLTLTEFPPVSTAEWDAVVLKDQKGVAPKTRLFYRAEDLTGLEYLESTPGKFPYTRGTRTNNDWRICQVVHSVEGARAAVQGGSQELCFVVGDQDLDEILNALPDCPIHYETGGRALARAGLKPGSVAYEPLDHFDRAAELVRGHRHPGFRPITVRAHRFAEAGATAVQELAFALAEGVEMLDRIPNVAPAMVFSFSIGPQYFLEIAKLRAARTLWARICESFGLPAGDSAMLIHARTAHWTKTIYDWHVNLLRSTTEAMAAAIGGVDVLIVEPFDETYRQPGVSSARLARNTQLILKHEAGLAHTVDAAGGSYYIETLTDSLAREAWKLLQQIEAAGGFIKYAAAGDLDRVIAKSLSDREAAVSTRRASIVGTNQYPNPLEHMLPEIERPDPAPRPARIFEEIRLRTERASHTPKFLLLEAGDLKMRKARSGFAANFFGCAGFQMETSETLTGDPDVVVLCSSDPQYASLAPRVIQQLRDAGKSTPVIVAGNPTDSIEQLKQAGVADFVHIRSNAAEVLRAWQDRLGVKG